MTIKGSKAARGDEEDGDEQQAPATTAIALEEVVRLVTEQWGHRLSRSKLDGIARLDGRPVEKLDYARIRLAIETQNWVRTRAADVRCAIDLVVGDRAVHPVCDYLNARNWDGTARLDRVLIDDLGAEDTPLNRKLGAAWLIGACARVFQPGCALEGALVLIGGDGSGSAGAWEALVPDPNWLREAPIDTSSTEALVTVYGSWFFHLNANESLTRARPDARKAFLTRRVGRFRQLHGAQIDDHALQHVYVATFELESWLQTPLRGSDLWTVVVGQADTDALRRDRDQLFAEAVARYRSGEAWSLDEAHRDRLAEVQRDLFDPTPPEQKLEAWVKLQKQPFTALAAAYGALGVMPEAGRTEAVKQRVGKMLAALGCARVRPREGAGARPWLWRRPDRWGGGV